jgi:hypothetical protein
MDTTVFKAKFVVGSVFLGIVLYFCFDMICIVFIGLSAQTTTRVVRPVVASHHQLSYAALQVPMIALNQQGARILGRQKIDCLIQSGTTVVGYVGRNKLKL